MARTRLTLRLSSLFALLFALTLVPTTSYGQDKPAGAEQNKPKRADEKRARQHFEQGRLAFTEARYEDALLHFERSYALSGKPQLLFNLANVLDRLRRDEEAVARYREYLNALPSADNRVQVEERLAVLQRSLDERQAAQVVPVVPTPQEVAAAELNATPAPTPAAPLQPPSETRPLYRKWWVWTAVGTVVVAAVVIGVVSGTRDQETRESPLLLNGMTRKVEL